MKSLACFVLLTIFCGFVFDSNLSGQVRTKPIVLSEYGAPEIIGQSLGLRKPNGIYVLSDRIAICDTGNNRVIFTGLDADKIYSSISGPAVGLDHPMDIAPVGQDWVVLDAFNTRLLVVQPSGKIKKEFALPRLDDAPAAYNGYRSLAIDRDGTIYVSTEGTLRESMAHVFRVSSTGVIETLGSLLAGYLTLTPNGVYLATSFEIRRKGFFPGSPLEAFSGANVFMKFGGSSNVKFESIDNDLFPQGIVFGNEGLYVRSGGLRTIEKYDLSGHYLGRVAGDSTKLMTTADELRYLKISEGGDLYSVNRDLGLLVRWKKLVH